MDKPVEAEAPKLQEPTSKLKGLRKKTGLAASAAILGAVTALGPGVPQPIQAAGETPTPTSTATATKTATPTPDILATQVANSQAELEEVKKRKELEAQGTAIAKQVSAAKGTPTETSTSTSTPTPDKGAIDALATTDAKVDREMAKLKLTATAQANATAAKEAEIAGQQAIAEVAAMKTAVAKGELPSSQSSGGGGIPGWLIAIPLLGGLALGGYKLYRRFKP